MQRVRCAIFGCDSPRTHSATLWLSMLLECCPYGAKHAHHSPAMPRSLVDVLDGAAHGVDLVPARQVACHALLKGAVPARAHGGIAACMGR